MMRLIRNDDQESFNIFFVQTVEKFRCLYDSQHKDYGNKPKQDDAWEQVAKVVGEENPELCRIRWRNLRGSLLRYMKQRAMGQMGRHKKQYYLAEYMKFVVPFTKPKIVSSNSTSKFDDCDDGEYDFDGNMEYDGAISNEMQNDLPLEADIKVDDDEAEAGDGDLAMANSSNNENGDSSNDQLTAGFHPFIPTNNISRPSQLVVPEIQIPRKRKLEDTKNFYFRSEGEIRNQTQQKSSDSDLFFFRSLLEDMQQLNTQQKRKVKIGILKLIDDAINQTANSSKNDKKQDSVLNGGESA